jgi:hypothetical protein
VPRQRLIDLIDRMRVAVPKEVYDSRDLLERQEEVLRAAHEDAEMMLAEARAQVEERLKEDALVTAAQQRARDTAADAEKKADDLLRDAETQARQRLDEAAESSRAQMKESDAYALQTLNALEDELDRFLTTVRKGIETLEQRAAERPGG